MNDNKNSMKGTAVPTFEYKADAATPCLTLIPAPVTLEYTHGTAMIGSLVTIEKRIPEYAVTEDAMRPGKRCQSSSCPANSSVTAASPSVRAEYSQPQMKPTPVPMPPKKREMRAWVRVRARVRRQR